MDTLADYEKWKAAAQMQSTKAMPDNVAGHPSNEFAGNTGTQAPPATRVDEYRRDFQQAIEQEKNRTQLSSTPRLTEWLRNPDNATAADRTPQLVTSISLCAVAGVAAYLAFRYRSQIKSAAKSVIVAAIVFAVRAARYTQAEAVDIKTQVERGLDQTRSREVKSSPASGQEQTGRLRFGGRVFLNLTIAPLLLGIALIGAVVVAGKLGLIN